MQKHKLCIFHDILHNKKNKIGDITDNISLSSWWKQGTDHFKIKHCNKIH